MFSLEWFFNMFVLQKVYLRSCNLLTECLVPLKYSTFFLCQGVLKKFIHYAMSIAFSFSFKILRDYISPFSLLFWERPFETSALEWYLGNIFHSVEINVCVCYFLFKFISHSKYGENVWNAMFLWPIFNVFLLSFII